MSVNGHIEGDDVCDGCTVAARGFPEPHGCGGLLHANCAQEKDGAVMQAVVVGDDCVTVSDVVDLCCDRCGATEQRTVPAATC